ARIGLGQLPQLAAFTERRRALARRYFQRWDRDLGCELPVEDYEQSNWHMFQVLLPERSERARFIARMRDEGIGVGVHHPALQLFKLYRRLGWPPAHFPHPPPLTPSLPPLP